MRLTVEVNVPKIESRWPGHGDFLIIYRMVNSLEDPWNNC